MPRKGFILSPDVYFFCGMFITVNGFNQTEIPSTLEVSRVISQKKEPNRVSCTDQSSCPCRTCPLKCCFKCTCRSSAWSKRWKHLRRLFLQAKRRNRGSSWHG